MSIIDQKREIFANLGAIDALGKIPKPNLNSSLSSISNETNSTDFLINLTETLVGLKALKDYVVDTITYRLPQIEQAIKDGLKRELKELVSCNLNPTIPDWFKNDNITNTGVRLKVTDIDGYDIMKVDPTTLEGGLIYTDVSSGVNSSDFNTYLYYTIQSPNTPTIWTQPGVGTQILETTFTENGNPLGLFQNNVVQYRTPYGVPGTPLANKTLIDFNNDFIDSLSLFGNPFSLDSSKMIALIMEELFGNPSPSSRRNFTIKKNRIQFKKELEIKEILDCILNSEDDNITDNFFTFDNPTLARIDRETNNRVNGIREVETCGNLKVDVPIEVIDEAIKAINNTTTQTSATNVTPNKPDETKAVSEALETFAEIQADFAIFSQDKETVKRNFFIEIIRKFNRIIMSAIMTPEFISLFAINHQIIYGQGTTYDGIIDFIKKNKQLVKNIGKIVLQMLLNLLLNLTLLYITFKLKQKFADDQIEKAKNYVSILLGLTGVPPGIIAQIRKVNTQPIPSYLTKGGA